MELALLEDFLALARERNFSRAAETRHISQPAFRRRVRLLEDWLQAPLLERVRIDRPVPASSCHICIGLNRGV